MSIAERKTQRECEVEVFGGNKASMEKHNLFYTTLNRVQNAFCETATILMQERGRIRPTTLNDRVSPANRKTGRAAEFLVIPCSPGNCTKETRVNTNNQPDERGKKGTL